VRTALEHSCRTAERLRVPLSVCAARPVREPRRRPVGQLLAGSPTCGSDGRRPFPQAEQPKDPIFSGQDWVRSPGSRGLSQREDNLLFMVLGWFDREEGRAGSGEDKAVSALGTWLNAGEMRRGQMAV
jgi:hypothetical protein